MTDRAHDTLHCAHCGLPLGQSSRASVPSERLFCCYGCALVHQIAGGRAEQTEASWLMSRLGLSLFLAMNVMMLTMIVYTPHFYPRDTGSSGQFQEQFLSLTRYALLLFSTPVVALLGLPILYSAVRAGLRRHFGVDALIALGCFAAFGLSVWSTFAGSNAVYYETATMVLVLVSFGRYLEARAKSSSARSIEQLLTRDVPVVEAAVGDEVPVLPGATFPVDGVVLRGEGHVNEAMLTGESLPVTKRAGDRVFAGTISVDGSFTVRVTAVGWERRLARIVRLLDEVRESKSPAARLADRVAGWFVPVTISLALGTFAAWTVLGEMQRGLLHALAVLLIACPCALGIATPLAIWNGIERAARRGIFVRSGEILETLAAVRAVFFDKTGTLTEGRPVFRRVEWMRDAVADENALFQRIGSIEQHSEHPLARAVCAEAQNRRLQTTTANDVRIFRGRGLAGKMGDETSETVVGNAAFLRERGIDTNGLQEVTDATVLYCAWDGRTWARIEFADSVRDDARATLLELSRQGYRLLVLTGDNSAAARLVAEKLGVEARGDLSPEDKVRIVAGEAALHPVAMVGDGINDAPAIGRACVGIAMGGGTDVAREAADVTFADNELAKLPWLFRFARRVRATIRVNLFWAFLYNLVCLPLAVVGLLTPIWAALAMVLSSAFVVANSMRLRRSS